MDKRYFVIVYHDLKGRSLELVHTNIIVSTYESAILKVKELNEQFPFLIFHLKVIK